MIDRRTLLELFAKALVYSLIVIAIDLIVVIFAGRTDQTSYTLSLVVLLEGGICLIGGGASVLYSPSMAKLNEVLFHSKPWNASQQRQLERQMRVLIGTGALLVAEAMIISMVWIT